MSTFIYADLHSIGFYYDEFLEKDYLIDDLTKVYADDEVTLSGFDNYVYFGGTVLYPSDDLFPSDDLYPTPSGCCYTKTRYTYKIHSISFVGEEVIDTILDTYYIDKNLVEQTQEQSNGVMTSKYKFERGDI